MSKALYSVKETAILLFGNYSPGTRDRVYRFIENGKLCSIKDGKKNWISKSELSKHGVINFGKIDDMKLSPPATKTTRQPENESTSINRGEYLNDIQNKNQNFSREKLKDNQRKWFSNVSKLKMKGAKRALASHCKVRAESVSRWISGRVKMEEQYLPALFEWVGYGSSDEIWGVITGQNREKSAGPNYNDDTSEKEVIQNFQKEMKERFGYSEVKIKLSREVI